MAEFSITIQGGECEVSLALRRLLGLPVEVPTFGNIEIAKLPPAIEEIGGPITEQADRCRFCGQVKPVGEFVPDHGNPGQYFGFCRACNSEQLRVKMQADKPVAKLDAGMTHKTCRECGQEKPIEEFPKAGPRAKTERSSLCQVCFGGIMSVNNAKRQAKRANARESAPSSEDD